MDMIRSGVDGIQRISAMKADVSNSVFDNLPLTLIELNGKMLELFSLRPNQARPWRNGDAPPFGTTTIRPALIPV
jgi:hypothetical protein